MKAGYKVDNDTEYSNNCKKILVFNYPSINEICNVSMTERQVKKYRKGEFTIGSWNLTKIKN